MTTRPICIVPLNTQDRLIPSAWQLAIAASQVPGRSERNSTLVTANISTANFNFFLCFRYQNVNNLVGSLNKYVVIF